MKKKQNDYTDDIRSICLKSLYDQMRRSCDFSGVTSISSELEQYPMPLHLISLDMAHRVYRSFFVYNRPLHYKSAQKQILYSSFLAECTELRKSLTDDSTIIQRALLSPAPCCGLGQNQIRRILRAMGCK